MMKPPIFVASAVVAAGALLTAGVARAQTKVALYAAGKPGTAQYEELSFWVREGKRSEVYYARGAAGPEIKGSYWPQPGKTKDGRFAVRLADNRRLTIVPDGNRLRVVDSASHTAKSFAWKYEGPVDGRGTFCRECAASPAEAMQLLRTYYRP